MIIKARIKSSLPPLSGQGANGEWIKRAILVECGEQYPKLIQIDFWNDNGNKLAELQKGVYYDFHVNIESKEHDGKYFTNVSCWKVEGQTIPAQTPSTQPASVTTETDDDLPF